VIMSDRNFQTIEQVRQFLGGSEAFFFRALSMGERYNWIDDKTQGSRERRKG